MVLLLLPLRIPTAITRCREIQTPIEGGASCATTTAAFCTNTGATSCSTAPASSSTTATPSALRGRCSVPLGIVAAARLHRPGGTMVAVVAVFTALVKRLLRRRRDDEVDSRPKSCPRWCWCLLRVRGCATTTATFCTNTAASSCSTTPAILQHNAAPSALRGRCSVPRSGPALRIVAAARLPHAGGTMVPHAALGRLCATTTSTFCSVPSTAAPSTLRGRCSVPRSGPALGIVVEARLHRAGGTMVAHAALRR